MTDKGCAPGHWVVLVYIRALAVTGLGLGAVSRRGWRSGSWRGWRGWVVG